MCRLTCCNRYVAVLCCLLVVVLASQASVVQRRCQCLMFKHWVPGYSNRSWLGLKRLMDQIRNNNINWGSKIIPHDISVIVGFPYSSQNLTWISLLHCMVNRDLFRAPKALTHQNVVWFTVVPYHPCMLCLCSCWLISMVPINLYWQTKKNGHGRHWIYIYILPMDSIRP